MLIVAALTAGAAGGLASEASIAVKDAYGALKSRVRKRIADQPGAEYVLARHEEDPEAWEAPLKEELVSVKADHDPELVAVARALLGLVDESGARAGKYTVDVRGAQGVQLGDYNTQSNVFNLPPTSRGS